MTFLHLILLFLILVKLRQKITKKEGGFIARNTRGFILPMLVIIFIQSFAIQGYRVPTGSMYPTIEPGSTVIVNKLAYGLNTPIVNTLFFSWAKPRRGDIIMLDTQDFPVYTKRVIAVSGDTVEIKGNRLLINGQYISTEWKDQSKDAILKSRLDDQEFLVKRTAELDKTGDSSFVVPEGEYFVMGDNRENSVDSRYFGSILENSIFAKVLYIL